MGLHLLDPSVLHSALGRALAQSIAGEPIDFNITISDDSITVSGYKPTPEPAKWAPLGSSAGVDRSGTVGSIVPTSAAGRQATDGGADEASMIDRSSFKFQIGSHVVLETSRSAYEQRVRDEKENLTHDVLHDRVAVMPVATLRAFIGPIEEGEVIGRAEYAFQVNHYLVRYRAGDGRQTESWWAEDSFFQPDPDDGVDEDATAG